MRLTRSAGRVVGCVIAAIAVAACQGSPRGGAPADSSEGAQPPAAGTTAPPAPGAQGVAPARIAVDSLRPDSLLALARRRQFDSLRGRTDEQMLMGSGRAAGPLAEIQPEVGAFRATRAMLASGYVVGRIVNRDTLAYAAVNLAPRDTVYWWVDSTAAGWRATFVSSRAGARPLVRPMQLEEHADQRHSEPSARWLVATTGMTEPWMACTLTGCCKPS
jgi:hypothetical protein